MALIKCPECGKEISNKAPACIHCGCPSSEFPIVNEIQKEVIENASEKEVEPSPSNICIFRNKEQDVSCISQYYSPMSLHDKIHFKQFLELEYGISSFQPVISKEQFSQFDAKLKEWSEFYFLTIQVTAKLALECIEHNFCTFEFDVLPRCNKELIKSPVPQQLQPTNSNVVRCPRCGSTSVTTEEKGYGLFGWIGASQKKNLCQKCGHKWWPGR